MLPTILSQSDLRRFGFQISNEKIGVDGQEKLKYSQVVIQGLGGVGVATMCGLLTAGVGKVRVIDNGIVTEDMLSSQTLFGVDDIGKLRCIAAREKQIGGALNESLKLYNTTLKNENADRLIGEAKVIVKTIWEPEYTTSLFDIADEKGLCLVGASDNGWKGLLGKYSHEKKNEFRQLYHNLHQQYNANLTNDCNCKGFGFTTNFIGSILSCITIKALLNIETKNSELYQINMLDLQIKKLL